MYINPRILALYDEYTHAPPCRRRHRGCGAAAKSSGKNSGDPRESRAQRAHVKWEHDHASTRACYKKEAAELAWSRTMAFLGDALR